MRWVIREEAAGSTSQDRVEVFDVDGGVIVALADGAGGMAGGEEAASMVVDAFRHASPSTVTNVLETMDSQVLTAPRAGETTAVVLAITGDVLWGASAGDSEAWCLHAHHDYELTRQQQRKRLGSGKARVQTFSSTSEGGPYRLLVASDGLFKYAPYPVIKSAARLTDLNTAADALLQCVRLPSGRFHDDVSLFLGEWP